MNTILFIDTNVFLHYQGFDQIDWLSLSQTKQVLVVLPPVVFRELNKHKDLNPSQKIRKRAQSVLGRLSNLLKTSLITELRPNVKIEALPNDPIIDFGSHSLRSDLQDDFLLASILEFRAKDLNIDCRLVTADIGLQLKCRSRQILTIDLPDSLRLPEEEDPNEKRAKELEAEIRDLKHQLPSLQLTFENKSKLLSFRILSPQKLDEAGKQARLEAIKTKFPQKQAPMTLHYDYAKGSEQEQIQEWHREIAKIANYNYQLEQFYKAYPQYFDSEFAYQAGQSITVTLKLVLDNVGSAPAEDIHVFLKLTGDFRLLLDEQMPSPPEPPEPPKFPPDAFYLKRKLKEQRSAMEVLDPNARYKYWELADPIGDCVEAQIQSEYLKHSFQRALPLLHVVFNSLEAVRSFGVDYRINAGNIPRDAEGRLNVVVKKDEHPLNPVTS